MQSIGINTQYKAQLEPLIQDTTVIYNPLIIN
jgi:hypothetical protein